MITYSTNPFILKLFFGVAALLFTSVAFGQDSVEEKKNSFTGNMAFSFVPTELGENFNEVLLIVPTVGLKFDRHLSPHWRIGLHADFLLEQFELVKDEGGEVFGRSYPVNLCVMASYVFHNDILVSAGLGQEFETRETFSTITLGVDYEIELTDYWDVVLMSSWDYRISHYSSFLVGIGFARSF